MLLQQWSPVTSSAYQVCLSLLNNCKTLHAIKQIQANFLKMGIDTNPFLAGKLILQCSIAINDALCYARKLLLYIPNPDVFMYNTIIRGLSESDRPQDSFTEFIEMRRKSINPPDSFSFAFILKAAANCRCFTVGIQSHCQSLVYGLDTHLFVGTTLISFYAECGRIEFARKVFDEMLEPNVVAWNAIITACFRAGDIDSAARLMSRIPLRNLTTWNVILAGYTKAGELELARKTFDEIPVKDDVSWSTMIIGFAHAGCFDDAFRFFKELLKAELTPNEVSLTGVLLACAQTGAFEFCKVVHGFVEKAGFTWLVSVNNALIDTYSKCGNVYMARLVFDRMQGNKPTISWTSMIAGLAMHGQGKEALRLFNEMENYGTRPDCITFISLLYACSHAGLVNQGNQVFHKMKDKYDMEPTIEHYGCMVDMYGRAGKLKEAYDFIGGMPIPPNVVIWRTLLGACSIQGNIEIAEQVKERLGVLDPHNSGDRVLLSNIYAISQKWSDVATIRKSMASQEMKKDPGWSVIEVGKVLYSFTAGPSRKDIITEEAYEKLQEIMSRLKVEGGYVAEVTRVLHDIEEEEKEDSISNHSEKLAVAFGMGRQQGTTIRIVKNLRICSDCHGVMKLISKIYGLEIVVRDRSRFHSFKDGLCSCRDYW